MSSSFVQTFRQFPTNDEENLQKQLVNMHTEFSTAINNRTISTFSTNSIADGERWFPESGQQRLRDGNRQVFQISESNLVINHGIALINQVTRIYGTFFNGSFWNTIPYVDVVSTNNQINVKVSSSQIIITKGGGSPPIISSGFIVLEYL